MGSCCPAVRLSALAAVAAGALGCQVVFGLDGYDRAEGAPACSPPPRDEGASGAGICRVRYLDELGAAALRASPGASCSGGACSLYYEGAGGIQCATCPDLARGSCDAPKLLGGLPADARMPYLRKGKPELWVSFVIPGDDDQDIHVAPIQGDCAVGQPVLVRPTTVDYAPVNISGPDDERHPAISPNGKTLFFTRCDADGVGDPSCRIHVAHRSADTGPFEAEQVVAGLRAKSLSAMAADVQPRPVWADDEDAVEVLYFASTRDASPPSADASQLDVFVARRAAGSAWDDPFEPPERIDPLSSAGVDTAPLPLDGATWLSSRNVDEMSARISVIDVGCDPRFGPLDPGPFTNVNTDEHERAPAITGDALLFSRADPAGSATLFWSPGPAGAWRRDAKIISPDIGHVVGAEDTDPLQLPSGQILFASDRETPGLLKLWIVGSGIEPRRVFSDDLPEAEAGPFVDEDGALWLSWGRGSDPEETVIARAGPDGAGGWLPPAEVEGLGHEEGWADRSPRLSADGRTLVFVSTRPGGFAPASAGAGATSVPTVWVATREGAGEPWEPPFPLGELGSVNGVEDPWISPDGCTLTLATMGRDTGFRWDLMSATRLGPAP
jgi:hypothetical protein